jgi:hypothetical protein
MSNTTLQANIHAGENITARQFWEQYFVVLENNERPLMTLTEPGQSTAYSYTFPKTLSREILEFTKQSDKRLLLFLFALLAVIHRKISFNRLVFFTSSLLYFLFSNWTTTLRSGVYCWVLLIILRRFLPTAIIQSPNSCVKELQSLQKG